MVFQRRHTDGQQVHEKVLNTTNHHRNANQNHNEALAGLLSWLEHPPHTPMLPVPLSL